MVPSGFEDSIDAMLDGEIVVGLLGQGIADRPPAGATSARAVGGCLAA